MPPAAAAPLTVFYRGALRARLVAPLAGTTPNQLAAWHRRSILTSSFIKGRRGVPRLYSWIDYQKARALVALIEQGIQRPRLGPQIAALDAEVDEWWKLPLLAYSNYVIVPRDDAPGYTIVEKQGAMDDLIRDAPLRSEDVSADDAELAIDVIRVLRAEGPLGRLAEYREFIDMDPRIQDGHPIVSGRRIETGMLAKLSEWGRSRDELADRFDLATQQVEAALAFEQALAA